jgi:hypothetical protein
VVRTAVVVAGLGAIALLFRAKLLVLTALPKVLLLFRLA